MSEEDVLKIQKETGCDPVFAKMVYKFTGNDIDGAIRIIKAVDKNVYIIRGKFIAQEKKIYGAFVIFLNNKTNSVDKITVVIKYNDKNTTRFNFDASWNEYEKDIINFAKRSPTEYEMESKFLEMIKSHKTIHSINSKIVRKKEYDIEGLRLYFQDLLLNLTGDPHIAIKFKIEKSDVFEVNKGNVSIEDFNNETEMSKDIQQPVEEEKTTDVLNLLVEPVVAPVNGTELSELELGDLIGVKIIDERPIGEYIYKLMGNNNNDNDDTDSTKMDSTKIVYAKLIDIKTGPDDGIFLKMEFGPGIFGSAFFGENVKILTMSNDEISDNNNKKDKKNVLIKNFWLIGGGLLAIIIVLLLLLLRPT